MKSFQVLFLIVFISVIGVSQNPGELDPSYNNGSVVSGGLNYAIALQTDGKILVGSKNFQLIRLLNNGIGDPTFVSAYWTGNGEINSIAIQSDGKIIAAGNIRSGIAPSDILVIRYNQNGSLDTSFASGGIFFYAPTTGYDYARDVAIQSDNKIVLSCEYSSGMNNSDVAVIRLNSNGTYDNSFGVNGIRTFSAYPMWEEPHSVKIQTDGKIVIAGHHTSTTGRNLFLARINPNGNMDSTFSGDGIYNIPFCGGAYDMLIQPDGKYVIAGTIHLGTVDNYAVYRFNPNATIDGTFGVGGVFSIFLGYYDYGRAIALQSDGKILFAGYQSSNSGGNALSATLFRLLSNGTVDPTFSNDGYLVTDLSYAYDIAIQPDGKILLAGDQNFPQVNGRVERYYAKNYENTLNFDGSNDYVEIPDNDNGISSAFTVETWVNWQQDGVQFICGKSVEQMEIHTSSGGNLRFIPTSGVYLDATNVLPIGRWTHIACIYDPSQSIAKMYINGKEVALVNNGSNPITTPMSNTTSVFNIGRRSNNSLYFKGSIDEFRIWNRLRSLIEIEADFIHGISPIGQDGLVSYYTFNQGIPDSNNTTVTSFIDNSGTFNGVLNNFSLSGGNSNWIESYAMVVPIANSAININDTSFTAYWTKPTVGIVENYFVEVATDSNFTAQIPGSPFTVFYLDSTLLVTSESNNIYYYRISANKNSVNHQGAYSNTIAVNTHSYIITTSVNPVGSGTVSGAGVYYAENTVTLTATENTGYTFKNWTENGIPVSTNSVYTFTANANRTIVANYSIVPVADMLTFSTNHSGVQTRYPNANVYNLGNIGSTDALTSLYIRVIDDNIETSNRYVMYNGSELGQLNFQGNSSWVFIPTAPFNWSVGLNTMTTQFADYDGNLLNITVNFTLVQEYSIAANAYPISSGTISGTGLYNQGSTVVLAATANPGYSFVNWTENGIVVSTNANYTFIANANRTLVANFNLISEVRELIKTDLLKIYPNPTIGFFIIFCETQVIKNIVITDISGKIIYSSVDQKINSLSNQQIDLSKQLSGMYFIKIITNKNILTGKIVKE